MEKNKSATNPITCGRANPDIFLSDDVKRVSRHNMEGEQSKFSAIISLYCACSEEILVQRRIFLKSQLFFGIQLPSTRIRRIRQRIRKNKSALQSGKKYIRSESDNVWTGPEWNKMNPQRGRVNPDIFLSDDVKSVSSLSPNNKPRWRHNVEGEQSKFSATISLYGACSEDILVQRSLGS